MIPQQMSASRRRDQEPIEHGSESEGSFKQSESESSFNSMSTGGSASPSDHGEEEFDNDAILKATKRLHARGGKSCVAFSHGCRHTQSALHGGTLPPPCPMPSQARLCRRDMSHLLTACSHSLFPPRHVLVVEDDAFTRKMIVEMVIKGVHVMMPHVAVDVETSETAAGALAICSDKREDCFDLVLLDYMLPGGCNADVVLPSLRTMCGGVPAVVMLSSNEMVTPLKQCLNLGADAFRLKPLNATALNELVQYTLRKRHYVSERLSRPQSPCRSPNFRLLDGAEHVLAVGRLGRLRIGMYHRGAACRKRPSQWRRSPPAPPPRTGRPAAGLLHALRSRAQPTSPRGAVAPPPARANARVS